MNDPAQSYLVVLLLVALISLIGQGLSAWLSSQQMKSIGERQNEIAEQQLSLDAQRHEQTTRSALRDRQAKAYIEVIAEANEQYNQIWDLKHANPGAVRAATLLESYSKVCAPVELFGSEEARVAARALGSQFIDWCVERHHHDAQAERAWDEYMKLVEIIRRDVGAS